MQLFCIVTKSTHQEHMMQMESLRCKSRGGQGSGKSPPASKGLKPSKPHSKRQKRKPSKPLPVIQEDTVCLASAERLPSLPIISPAPFPTGEAQQRWRALPPGPQSSQSDSLSFRFPGSEASQILHHAPLASISAPSSYSSDVTASRGPSFQQHQEQQGPVSLQHLNSSCMLTPMSGPEPWFGKQCSPSAPLHSQSVPTASDLDITWPILGPPRISGSIRHTMAVGSSDQPTSMRASQSQPWVIAKAAALARQTGPTAAAFYDEQTGADASLYKQAHGHQGFSGSTHLPPNGTASSSPDSPVSSYLTLLSGRACSPLTPPRLHEQPPGSWYGYIPLPGLLTSIHSIT